MFYFLMHKDKMVALCKDNETIEIYEEKLIPIGAKKKEEQYDITDWKEQRKIPENRINFYKIKDRLDKIEVDIENLHRYNYGLSLTDNYWYYEMKSNYLTIKTKLKMKRYEKELPKYDSISYYSTLIDTNIIPNVLYDKEINIEDMRTPDFTTNGKNQKYWVTRNNEKFLVKQNDAIYNYVAEKEVLASFVCYVINECRKEKKKKCISTASYRFEKGKKTEENCCFSNMFTSEEEELVTYKMIMNHFNGNDKKKKMKQFLEKDGVEIKNAMEYIEFIILLDFLTENNRDETDIGFIFNNNSCRIIKPAPLYGSCNAFDYMTKDFTRANKNLYSSKHINVFGMNEEEQCKYIAENMKWFAPEIMYKKLEPFAEYLVNEDMTGIPRQHRENIMDWLKYKIVLIANEKRQIAIAEEAEKNGEERMEYSHYEEED